MVARLRLLWGVADKDYWRVSKEIKNYQFWILKKKNPRKWYKTDFLLIFLSFLYLDVRIRVKDNLRLVLLM